MAAVPSTPPRTPAELPRLPGASPPAEPPVRRPRPARPSVPWSQRASRWSQQLSFVPVLVLLAGTVIAGRYGHRWLTHTPQLGARTLEVTGISHCSREEVLAAARLTAREQCARGRPGARRPADRAAPLGGEGHGDPAAPGHPAGGGRGARPRGAGRGGGPLPRERRRDAVQARGARRPGRPAGGDGPLSGVVSRSTRRRPGAGARLAGPHGRPGERPARLFFTAPGGAPRRHGRPLGDARRDVHLARSWAVPLEAVAAAGGPR